MRLAKPAVDLGLNTNNLAPMLAFWQNDIGLPFDHVLPIRKGTKQHRHNLLGSVLKINHYDEKLPASLPSGFVELLIARDAIGQSRQLRDPDGNRVTLVDKARSGITQIAIRMSVRDPDAHARFFQSALGLEETSLADERAFQAGQTLLFFDKSREASSDATMEGKGYRYITFQVFKTDIEHAHILANGGREAVAPVTLGGTARISMVRDPDGNWIEISQRASITGSLES
jgi:catechol 2,3-dioxygenase-like lactoylglutathione lyase family enzyme